MVLNKMMTPGPIRSSRGKIEDELAQHNYVQISNPPFKIAPFDKYIKISSNKKQAADGSKSVNRQSVYQMEPLVHSKNKQSSNSNSDYR